MRALLVGEKVCQELFCLSRKSNSRSSAASTLCARVLLFPAHPSTHSTHVRVEFDERLLQIERASRLVWFAIWALCACICALNWATFNPIVRVDLRVPARTSRGGEAVEILVVHKHIERAIF